MEERSSSQNVSSSVPLRRQPAHAGVLDPDLLAEQRHLLAEAVHFRAQAQAGIEMVFCFGARKDEGRPGDCDGVNDRSADT